jgi:hypothetical protein
MIIERADSKVVLMTTDSAKWRIQEPIDVPADTARIRALVDAVVSVEIGPTLAVDGPDLFGLEPPVIMVTLGDADGASFVLRVGDPTPVGGGSYVQTNDGLHTSNRNLNQILNVGLDQLRAREVSLFSPTAVDEIRIDDGESVRRISRDDHGWWQHVSNGKTRLDTASIQAFLRAIHELRVDKFGTQRLPAEARWTSFVLAQADTDTTVEVLQLEDGQWLARSGMHQQILEITQGLGLVWPSQAMTWFAKDAMPVNSATLTTVRLTLGDTTFSASRTETGWDDDRTVPILKILDSSLIDRRLSVEPPEVEWGRVVLREGEQRESVLTLYQPFEDGRIAQEKAGGRPFVLPASVVQELAAAID